MTPSPRQSIIIRETLAEYLDRGGRITRVPPSVAKNYLHDDSMLGLLIGEPLSESLRTDSERAADTVEVRDVQRDARVTDADWN